MDFTSIFNDVLGPVMRGPSSSHTAGSYHIGRIARSLLGETPASAVFTFDPSGSYVRTYREQGVDLGFAAGLLGWPITDPRFPEALRRAPEEGLSVDFRTERLPWADHPNAVQVDLVPRRGEGLVLAAKSTGGGGVLVTRLDGWPVAIDGKSYETFIVAEPSAADAVRRIWRRETEAGAEVEAAERSGRILLRYRALEPLRPATKAAIESAAGVDRVRVAEPIFFVRRGEPLFRSAADMVRFATEAGLSLGRAALAYETRILGMSEKDALAEMARRLAVMRDSARQGLEERDLRLQLLRPSARKIFEAESRGLLALGGPTARAAARALAVLHAGNSMGVVVAAPTGGAAGVLPGVILTLIEQKNLSEEAAALALFAAGAVGLVVAARATFAAAAGAFSSADLILGGYENPIPLDETIDAVFASGKMISVELRVTSLGGLAVAPSALALPNLRTRGGARSER
ncbi:MAG: L-serine ammonia-lyase, iron-sulfur-dependent, subunit alpha [Planctomycetota bacterium]